MSNLVKIDCKLKFEFEHHKSHQWISELERAILHVGWVWVGVAPPMVESSKGCLTKTIYTFFYRSHTYPSYYGSTDH